MDDDAIAIVGVGVVGPDAASVPEFWRNLIAGRDSIRPAPSDLEDVHAVHDPSGRLDDSSYTTLGAFVRDDAPLRRAERLAPHLAPAMDRAQAFALAASDEAVRDAGLDGREESAVVLGNALGGARLARNAYVADARVFLARVTSLPEWARLDVAVREELLSCVERHLAARARPSDDDRLLGESGGMFARSLGAWMGASGPCFSVDAACASGLAAVDVAIQMLRSRQADVVLTGAADSSMNAGTYVKFCRMGALSRAASRPFDERADGFVMGEGAAMFALQRLRDARAHGRKIRAVIRGVGSSSDGRGHSVVAPSSEGQALAIARAQAACPDVGHDIDLLEAHGTGTQLGDVTEARTLSRAFRRRAGAPRFMGSVKSQVGHLKSAAGAIGLLKTVLAVDQGKIPPSLRFERPNPHVDWASVPFEVATRAAPWPDVGDRPRRAAASAFGFGGVNYHVIVEQPA